MSIRHFNDNAGEALLQSTMDASDTSGTFDTVSSFPTQFPWPGTLDPATASAEQVLITGAAGSVLTMTRNTNGQGAFTHPPGAKLIHSANAQEFIEANQHIEGHANVHGVTGNVVGTSDSQTLTNKTFVGALFHATGGVPGVQADAAADSDIMFEGKNSAAAIVFKVDGVGKATAAGGADFGDDVDVDGAVSADSLAISGDAAIPTITGDTAIGGEAGAATLRATSTTDASLASTDHGFQVGLSSGINLIADNNEIMARNNGAASTLIFQKNDGNVEIGTAASTVTVAGTLVSPLIAPIYSHRVQTAGTSIPGDAAFHTLSGWTDVAHSTPDPYTGSGVWTVPAGADGIYTISAQFSFGPLGHDPATGGQRAIRIWKNGATDIAEFSRVPSQFFNVQVSVTATIKLAAGDTIQIQAFVSGSDGNDDLVTTAGQNYVTIARVSGA